MKMRTLRTEVVWPLITVIATVVSGCAGSQNGTEPTPSGVGRVESELTGTNVGTGVILVQSSVPSMGAKLGVKEIIVTVAKVTAHSGTAGWVTLSSTETTVDILGLGKYSQSLGFANMPAGKVTQVRLYLAENKPQYVTRTDGTRVDLKVPSGYQSGIKLKGMFDVAGCNLTSVPIEFDGKKSIWVHPTGQGDLWILRPVIRLGKVEASNVGCTPTNPNNPVTGSGGGTTIPTKGGTGGGTGSGGTGGGTGSGGTGGGDPFVEGGGKGGPGILPVNGAGGTCANNLNCLSGVCLNGICGKGGPDAPCAIAVDCASGTCSSGTCTVGTAGGTGSVCTTNTQCLSNGCVNGKCGEGGQGQPCSLSTDCAAGFACVSNTCGAQIN